ncbi:DUF1294 domain-containing protein [Aureimonas psammosilenae]|uniref:DUF1294 domain-containing protein n=1 Tax=Aureimonas psammosilenae TaxID=2495496 RepID=UPI0012613064|nr:DUF1294 domain-containing protein [Aureimonas psammosilenae]
MSSEVVIGVLAYVVAINVLAFAAMVIDKRKAEHCLRRIPEATLLQLALLGGSVGTVLAGRTVRHKTRKEPFRSRLAAIIVLQVVALTALAVATVVAGSPKALWQLLTS